MVGLEGVDCGISHRLEKGTGASEDAGPRGLEWIVESHIDWRRERVPTRTLAPREAVGCEIPHWLGRRTKHSLQGCSFKNFERKSEKESKKKTISIIDLGGYSNFNKENKEKERGG